MPSITIIDDLSPDTESAVRAAIAVDFPDRDARIRLCARESEREVVQVFLPVPKLMPSPYVIYAVDRRTHAVKRLHDDDAKPYSIPNYK